jgi:hypothetical protein
MNGCGVFFTENSNGFPMSGVYIASQNVAHGTVPRCPPDKPGEKSYFVAIFDEDGNDYLGCGYENEIRQYIQYDMSKYTIDEIKNKFKNIDVPDNYFTKRMKSAEDQLWNCKCKYHLFSKIAYYSLIIISSIPAIVFSVDLLKKWYLQKIN